MLAQPTREGQKKDTWRVGDQDIYGGDAIKQASDIVLTISVPYKWLRQNEPNPADQKDHDRWLKQCEEWKGQAEAGVLKARDGEDGLWRRLRFDGPRVRFADLDEALKGEATHG
jgi:hypothetical protein